MSYPGAKGQAGVYQRIIGQMPPHSWYLEAFAGSGEVFRRKLPANWNFLWEKNQHQADKLQTEFGIVGNTIVQCCDSLDCLKQATLPHTTLIYCDPPYILSTRKNRRYYAHEMTIEQHEKLLRVLTALDCMVMISGYPHPLYDELVQIHGWRCISYRTRTRGRTLTECLWCNFPEPTVLHDWRFAGKNHRQRVHFKRVAARWLNKLRTMAPLKRGYLLDAISRYTTPDMACGTVTPQPALIDPTDPHAVSGMPGRKAEL